MTGAYRPWAANMSREHHAVRSRRNVKSFQRKCRQVARARRAFPTLRLLLAILSAATLCNGAAFATYPERPVTLVVPFAPGGANDIVARIIQQPLGEALGQPIGIENRGGTPESFAQYPNKASVTQVKMTSTLTSHLLFVGFGLQDDDYVILSSNPKDPKERMRATREARPIVAADQIV